MMLDDIKARAAAATPGPWEWAGHLGVYIGLDDEPELVADAENDIDATFIAHSRDDIDWLVARVEELSAALREGICTCIDTDGVCIRNAALRNLEDAP